MNEHRVRHAPPPAPAAPPREGHTHGVGNYSGMRSLDSLLAELAGGLADGSPSGEPEPDPFDLDLAYPQGAELAGPAGEAVPGTEAMPGTEGLSGPEGMPSPWA